MNRYCGHYYKKKKDKRQDEYYVIMLYLCYFCHRIGVDIIEISFTILR